MRLVRGTFRMDFHRVHQPPPIKIVYGVKANDKPRHLCILSQESAGGDRFREGKLDFLGRRPSRHDRVCASKCGQRKLFRLCSHSVAIFASSSRAYCRSTGDIPWHPSRSHCSTRAFQKTQINSPRIGCSTCSSARMYSKASDSLISFFDVMASPFWGASQNLPSHVLSSTARHPVSGRCIRKQN